MFKKIEIWIVLLILLFFFIGTILFGTLILYHHAGGDKFPKIQRLAVFLAEIPYVVKKTIYPVQSFEKNNNLPRFKRFIKTKRNALLILPRYDGDLKRSIVEIIDINNFKVLHTYKHNINEMNNLIDVSNVEHERVKIDDAPNRFEYRHSLVLDDVSLIANSNSAPLFKIDICSNLIWINQEERFHHSKMLHNDGSIWVPSQMFPYSGFVKQYKKDFGFLDDAITKLDENGNILFIKSVSEILSENKIVSETLFIVNDPIHLNDIEPAFKTTKYWNEGDLFLSLKNQSAIMHYRPSTNKVVNYIKGPFYQQHDIDIISEKKISIFNNNNSILKNNKFSEILIYNFETKSFSKKFNHGLESANFKTVSQGLSEFLKDGSLLVEEQNYGRLILFNNNGEKEWEYVNKDSKGNVYFVSWARIIEDDQRINKIKNKIKSVKCSN